MLTQQERQPGRACWLLLMLVVGRIVSIVRLARRSAVVLARGRLTGGTAVREIIVRVVTSTIRSLSFALTLAALAFAAVLATFGLALLRTLGDAFLGLVQKI